MRSFIKYLRTSLLAYFSVVPGLLQVVVGHSSMDVLVSLLTGVAIFIPAAYVDYRRRSKRNEIPPSAERDLEQLDRVFTPTVVDDNGAWPTFIEVAGRAPSDEEIGDILTRDIGLALRNLPRSLRDLAFLSRMTPLRFLWIDGPVHVDAIAQLESLRHLTLFSSGTLSMTQFPSLQYYEGPLRGRDNVLDIKLRELHIDLASAPIKVVPPTLEKISLLRASRVENLDFLLDAPNVRYLYLDGVKRLDITAAASLRELTSLEIHASELRGLPALLSLRKLQLIRLLAIRKIEDGEVLEQLKGVTIEVVS